MDAKAYIEKVHKICAKFSDDCNTGPCPLFKYNCGLPETDIDEAIAFVENYDLAKRVRKAKVCPNCGKELKQ